MAIVRRRVLVTIARQGRLAVRVGEQLAHPQAGRGQRRVDVAAEAIATAELGFTMS